MTRVPLGRSRRPRQAEFESEPALRSRRLPARRRCAPSTPATRSWSRPRRARARHWWRPTPSIGHWRRAGKAFYTTPLKALSNQKYGELSATYGEEHVGLLTGDTTVRPRAPVVVMTTEVLRNMLLAGSDLLEGLHTVVLDEVHFLQDPYRGGVWEEVLVLSPPEIRFVCLSATVNNADELGAWLRSVRGDTAVIVERHRPIVLRHHFAVAPARRRGDCLVPLLRDDGRPGDEGLRIDQAVRRATQGGRSALARERAAGHGLPSAHPGAPRWSELLQDEEMLPAIVFIFSRAACDDAVRQVVQRRGPTHRRPAERAAIRAIAERRVEALLDEDLDVLGYDEWLEGLERGVAAHHAGLVPVFRETVEECFAAGLLKVVFATETLSLGINMPARSVVIERFTKYGGAGRATLTSGEYLQLTGRAGRRGLDAEGHAVVSWSSETAFAEAARVATAPPPDLRSAFRPTYNLAVNLVARFDRQTANAVLAAFLRAVAGPLARPAGPPAGPPHGAYSSELGYIDELGPDRRRARAGPALPRVGPADRRGAPERHPRRSRAVGPGRRALRPGLRTPPGAAGTGPSRTAARAGGAANRQDRLGEGARPSWRGAAAQLGALAERIRAVEEAHLVPRTRQPAPGLATAVASWARGASFATALGVAARDAGELAPGDFVRTVKSIADLAQQVSHTAADPDVAAAAREAVDLLLRGVCAGGLPGSLTHPPPPRHPGSMVGRACAPTPKSASPPTRRPILRRYVTNLDLPVFALVNLPEVVKGALFARYSRSPKSLRRLFLDEFVGDLDISGDAGVDATVGLERAEELYEKVFLEYGDDSVAQLGGVHLACEQSSNVLSKVLEWGRLMAYLEQSTRYIAYNQRLDNGQYRYYRPPEILDSPHGARFVGEMDRIFDTYGALLPRMQAWVVEQFPQQAGDSDFVYRQAIRAKSLDALRGLLPAASLSNIGMYGTGQSYEQLLLRMRAHPLPEARHYAELMLDRAAQGDPVVPAARRRPRARRGVVGSYLADTRDATARVLARLWPDLGASAIGAGRDDREVTLLDFDPDGEEKVLAAACFSHLDCSEREAARRVRSLGHDERVALLRAYVGERRNRRHRPGRAFERTDYRFELVTDYGAFRDLQRHRMLTIEWQRLGITLGYDMPDLVAEAGLEDRVRRGDRSGRGALPFAACRTFPSRRRTRWRWPTASATSCRSTRARRCT